MQGQPQSPELTGARVWTGSPAPCWKGVLDRCRHFPIHTGARCLQGPGAPGAPGKVAHSCGATNPSWSWGGCPWREPTTPHGARLCPGRSPTHPSSPSLGAGRKIQFISLVLQTLRSQDAQKVCTELKHPPFNSVIYLFIQQILMTYPL